MTGGLMQLVAYGAQDIFLTGNPQITFFKFVYRRHTNFAMEYIPQYFNVNPDFQTSSRTISRCKINRNADLVYDIYLVFETPSIYSTSEENFQWVKNLGENLMFSSQIYVNGLRLDIQYSQWLNVWSQLTIDVSKRKSYDKLIGNTTDMIYPQIYNGVFNNTNSPTIYGKMLYIPLRFWFCLNPGLAIPLIALQYTEIYIDIEFYELNHLFTMWDGLTPDEFYDYAINNPTIPLQPGQKITAIDLVNQLSEQGFTGPQTYFWKFVNGSNGPGIWNENCYLLCNYIYLDEDERKRFSAVSHEYLITQIQSEEFQGLNGVNYLELKLNNPVKELIFVTQRSDVNKTGEWNNYTNCLLQKDSFSVEFQTNIIEYQQFLQQLEEGTSTCLEDVINQDYENIGLNDRNKNILFSAKLILNGHDRFNEQSYAFFNALQPYKFHTNSPDEGIYVYSFCINPEQIQPSGTCNFSRINRAQLAVALRQLQNNNIQYNVTVYALTSNVFRIMGGIGSLVFSN